MSADLTSDPFGQECLALRNRIRARFQEAQARAQLWEPAPWDGQPVRGLTPLAVWLDEGKPIPLSRNQWFDPLL